MLSIQETISKTTTQCKQIKEFMDKHGFYQADFIAEDGSRPCDIFNGLKRSIQRELAETFHRATAKEFLSSYPLDTHQTGVGMTGAVGAQYIIPAYISYRLYEWTKMQDLATLICADVFEPRGDGARVDVAIVKARRTAEGGDRPAASPEIAQTRLALKRVDAPLVITNEMMEDTQFDLLDWHIRQGAQAMIYQSNELILNALINKPGAQASGGGTVATAATGGWGTAVGTTTASAATTLISEVTAMHVSVGNNGFTPDTMIITSEALNHSVGSNITTGAPASAGDITLTQYDHYLNPAQPVQGFHFKHLTMDTLVYNSPQLCTGASSQTTAGAAQTLCKTILFRRDLSLIAARRSWLRIENYVEPMKDLTSAVLSGRVDAATTNNYSIGILTEKA